MEEDRISRTESSDVIRVFPTFVWKTQLKAQVCIPLECSGTVIM